MSDKKDFELNEKKLDDVAGGYMVYGANSGESIAAGINKKTRKEDIRVFYGDNSFKEAQAYAKNNLIERPQVKK